jgi:FkbM family methyltransferase
MASTDVHELIASIARESQRRRVAWKPYSRGPRELWLQCKGTGFQRLVSWLHFHWPFARGQWRFMHTLSGCERTRSKLRAAPFVSTSGVEVTLDVSEDRFLGLSGRLAAEPAEIELARRLVGAGDVFVDVGAHWGLYVLHIAGRLRPGGTYVAAEPSRESFRFLSTAIRAPLVELQLHEVALSDLDGEAGFVADGSVNDHLSAMDGAATCTVKVVTMDTLLRSIPLTGRGVFIKVDTEGHEAAVVRGCAGLAASGLRPVFLLEFLREIHGQTRDDVLRAFASTFGPVYDFWAIDASDGRLARFETADEIRGDVRNMLAAPRP